MVRNMGGNMQQMMKAAQKMQKQMMEAQDSLKDKYVEGESGGGMVKVLVNGQKELVKVTIDRDFITGEVKDDEDVSVLEDLITAAVSDGMQKAQTMIDESMGQITGGLGGLAGLL